MHCAVSLGGLAVSRSGLEGAVEACRARIAERAGGYVCFVNVHSLTEGTRHAGLREALAGAAIRFADGMPLVWLARLKGAPIESRVAGPDFMEAMLRAEPNLLHGFIGGPPGRADEIASRFCVPNVTYSPPLRDFSPEHAREDWNAFVARCQGQVPDLVWVGLGAPKQEMWLREVSELAPRVTFFGVGAAFDFLAVAKRRAPVLLQRTGLEWTHRLASEPRRLWKRYLVSNARFVRLALRELV
jgi:N-acetylglucosaminyldiphosphoundecaprenol N-acetyl-beta-D-mannosaminyltransferase